MPHMPRAIYAEKKDDSDDAVAMISGDWQNQPGGMTAPSRYVLETKEALLQSKVVQELLRERQDVV